MKQLLALLLSSLLCVAPVAAQTTPTPPPPINNALIRDLSAAAQANGVLAVLLVGVMVVLALVVAVLLVAAWRGLSPLLGTVQKLVFGSVDVQERTAKILDTLETRQEAQARQQAINQHTDDALRPVASDVAGLREDFARFALYANGILGKLANKDDLAALVKPLKDAIDDMAERISKLEPTPEAQEPEKQP